MRVIGVPGYEDGIKPAYKQCLHLVPAEPLGNGKFRKARCLLHDTPDFPEECRILNLPGPNHQCALGQVIWKRAGVTDFEKQLVD